MLLFPIFSSHLLYLDGVTGSMLTSVRIKNVSWMFLLVSVFAMAHIAQTKEEFAVLLLVIIAIVDTFQSEPQHKGCNDVYSCYTLSKP